MSNQPVPSFSYANSSSSQGTGERVGILAFNNFGVEDSVAIATLVLKIHKKIKIKCNLPFLLLRQHIFISGNWRTCRNARFQQLWSRGFGGHRDRRLAADRRQRTARYRGGKCNSECSQPGSGVWTRTGKILCRCISLQ